METTFLVIFTLSYLFFQISGASSSNTVSSNVTCLQRERQSLLVFRQGLTDKSNRLSTWTGVECCEWQGVWCDRRNGHVVKLDLRSQSEMSMVNNYPVYTNNRLEGKVSPSLLNLKHLRHLDLSRNNFSGQNIPEFFGSFKYLEYLNLCYSHFSGVVPPHLGNLSRLEYLDLKSYGVYGPYFDDDNPLMVKDDMRWVSLLSSLKHLDLSGVTIGKHIDWFNPVNMLPSLLTLNLASCDINMISSIKFINSTSLNLLDLSSNDINSTIPIWLSKLTGLVHLDLKFNNFHGRIPNSIGNLSSLSYMNLSDNQLSGPIPPSFGGLSSLKMLSFFGNHLSGSIPESIGQLSMLENLELHVNRLNGSIPESIGLLTRLEVLNLGINQLSGSIPTSLGQLSNLQFLDLYVNRLNGSIPESIGLLTRLQVLNLGINQLSGSIPITLGQLSNLQRLYLYGNQLNGSIPESIGQLTRLQVLNLCINQLNGNIPTSLGKLSNLQSLVLDGNQLSGVISEVHFKKLKNLTELSLSNNPLTLNVSPHWIPLFQLKAFSARKIGPRLVSFIHKSTKFERLILPNSNIRDTIPDWFENITSHLQNLILSNNKISGNLPRIRNIAWPNMQKNNFLFLLLVAFVVRCMKKDFYIWKMMGTATIAYCSSYIIISIFSM